MLLHSLLRPLASGFHTRALERPVPRPADEPTIRSGRADAVRVLLLGSGVTTGWGVRTHGLGLAGALQRALQERLQQPVDVEQVSEVGALLEDGTRILGSRATERWDVVVVAFGLNDAIRLTPAWAWAQALDRLLARFDTDLPRGPLVPLLLVGIPPTDSLQSTGLLGPVYARHAHRLNALTERAAAGNRRTTWTPLALMGNREARPLGSPEAYQAWSGTIAEACAPLLAAQPGVRHEEAPSPRRLAGTALDAANAAVRTRLHDLASRLRADVDADLVLVNLIDGDRLWIVGDSTAGRPRSVPVDATFCATTLRDDLLHVPDTRSEPRFDRLAGTALQRFDSYAGVALRDAHGTAVGTVCLFDGGTGSSLDPAILRAAGREAERLLARLVSPVDGAAVFAQRAASAVPAVPPAPPPPARPAAAVLPFGVEQPLERRLSRRRRLSLEGRQLTRTAAVRSVPPERDVRIQGPDPVRVLLVGGEYAVGFGTRTRAEALDGALARLIHVRTGRGVVVENRSQHGVRLEQLAGSLGPAGAHTFDVVLWTPTFDEGARALLRSRWIAGLALLLRRVETTSDAAVVLLGFPALVGGQPLAVVGRARAAQINRLLRRIAARARVGAFVEPPPIVLGDVETVDGAAVYQEAAIRLLPTVLRLLAPEDALAADGALVRPALVPA